ncbi:MAG: AAA family ATPase [Micrococcales bacterium]|nr:AAA family ATPase [Micrococcales bacterium]MCL2668935.1 AAA family ATPase [Micrococcales bacterium]
MACFLPRHPREHTTHPVPQPLATPTSTSDAELPELTTLATELATEQHVLDTVYDRLDTLRGEARARLAEVRREGPSGSPQNRSERDSFATLYENRLAQLEAVEERLAFGRLDLHGSEPMYVGRIGLTDAEHTPLLTDWRAPAARAFYQATAVHPDGVRRRRHLVTHARAVTGLEDEVLDLSGEHLGTLSGEGALLAALAAGRTGRMGDIVATIQAEQDKVIRSDLPGALVVQGGPGTGKTAVALHRAAYLLYAHRRTLERSGVLLVGPSRTFLRYIDQVLPSLGETGVVTMTVAELVPGVHAPGTEPAASARIKGDLAMVDVLASAVRARERVPDNPVAVVLDGRTVHIKPDDVRAVIGRTRRLHRPHNLARVTFVREMLGRLADQYLAQLGSRVDATDRAEVVEDLRTHHDVRVALNLAWMPLTPQGLLGDLYAKPWRLEQAAPHLSEHDRTLLARDRAAHWTPDDVPLLDELAELLGIDDQAARAQARADAAQRAHEVEYAREALQASSSGWVLPYGAALTDMMDAEALAARAAPTGATLTTAERAACDRTWTYGHVVVDEAQELSPMAWRALLRRVPTRSLTIVGDVAQTGAPSGARSWEAMLGPVLGSSWRAAELTVNYRTPASVAGAADAFARAVGLPVSTLVSARDLPDSLVTTHVTPGDLATRAAQTAHDAVEQTYHEGAGRVALVAPRPYLAALSTALADLDRNHGLAGHDGTADLDAPLVLVTPHQTKGLEFDRVVLVEPAQVLATSGPGDLYVALTRPTQRLDIIHCEPLPDGLRQAV